MTHIGYTLAAPALAAYKVEVLRRGCCPALAEASICVEGADIRIMVHTGGLFHPASCMENRKSIETGRLVEGMVPLILGWLRRIIEACGILEEYMIFEEDISLRLEDLYFENERGPARLLLKPGGAGLVDALSRLCLEMHDAYPGCNADLVARRISERNGTQLLDRRALLSFLSSWEFELRS